MCIYALRLVAPGEDGWIKASSKMLAYLDNPYIVWKSLSHGIQTVIFQYTGLMMILIYNVNK